jgi:uncharacterized protein YceH (UPF0502 family)
MASKSSIAKKAEKERVELEARLAAMEKSIAVLKRKLSTLEPKKN